MLKYKKEGITKESIIIFHSENLNMHAALEFQLAQIY
jgi:hypothetical protein